MNITTHLPIFFTLLIFTFCAFIFARPLAVMLLITFLIILVLYLVSYLYNRSKIKKYENSIEGRSKIKLEYCQNAIKKAQQDIADIRVDIQELKNGLNTKLTIQPATKARTLKLIEEFQKELNLRELKIAFFETCVLKIRTILHNHFLTQKLYKKQLELQEMREKSYDDIAEMEELRTEFAYEKTYLDTIDELSNRMLLSDKISDAEHLTLELEALTHELREM